MSTLITRPQTPPDRPEGVSHARTRRVVRSTLTATGEPMLWLTGGGLAVCLVMILGLLFLVFWQGTTTFWPVPVVQVETPDGPLMGEVTRDEYYTPMQPLVDPEQANAEPVPTLSEPDQEIGAEAEQGATDVTYRRLFRTGNFDISGTHFHWVSDSAVRTETQPQWAIVVERLSWGRFYGTPKSFLIDDEVVAATPEEAWAQFEEHHATVRERWRERRQLETEDIGILNYREEAARLAARQARLDHGPDSPEYQQAQAEFNRVQEEAQREYAEIADQIRALNAENNRFQLMLQTAQGEDKLFPLHEIVRAYPANQLSFADRIGIYFARWWEFLSDDPREANSEGGVFPAIFGTVLMTLIMSIAVVPFGVLAALYLREYAKAGAMISVVRIAINNLAGVPSIVFGVFGLGFFCYIVGASIDELLFEAKLPSPTFGSGGILWASLTLALLTLPVVIVATEEALAAVPSSMREGSYACGASKWQTIRRIVLPRAMPGILTGMILAMARGAGEVAPLMLVGAVKLAPELPLDGHFPYFHLERSFMHLGFHIYDLGFQSQNSEAAKPMVYTTTLLLILIIAALNLVAIGLRSRLKRRFQSSAF